MPTVIRDVFARITATVAALRRPREFTCGDCERSDRCSLPPSDRCIVKAAQIASGDWTRKGHATTLRQL
jgi:hypothetical protein